MCSETLKARIYSTTRGARRTARMVALYAAIETLFVRGLNGAIGVSPTDSRLLHIVAGARQTVTIRNGVDLDYFGQQPQTVDGPPLANPSLVFWGRLDFEPNVDAVCWFAREVWPTLRRRVPSASWKIVGKNPVPQVEQLNELASVRCRTLGRWLVKPV